MMAASIEMVGGFVGDCSAIQCGENRSQSAAQVPNRGRLWDVTDNVDARRTRSGVTAGETATPVPVVARVKPRATSPAFNPRFTMDDKRPPGVSLLFASRAEIEAAPAEEREAYLAIVEGLLRNPEAAGFRYETGADRAAEDSGDNAFGGLSEDWGTA